MSKGHKYEIVLRNSEIRLTKEENQKKNSVNIVYVNERINKLLNA
jgi:hypothetical protein